MADKEFQTDEEAEQARAFALLVKQYKKAPYKELAIRMKELATLAADREAEAKTYKAELDLIRIIIVPERFAEENLTSLNIAGVGRLGLAKDMHCNVNKDDKEKFFNWMRENDFGDMIKPDVNSSSLKALIKELGNSEDEDQQELYSQIQDYVKVHPFMRASVTKT